MKRSDYWFICLLIVLSPRMGDFGYMAFLAICVVFLAWSEGKECVHEYRSKNK